MPYDLKDGSNVFAPTPKDDEIAAIREWINSLKGVGTLACQDRKFISNDDVINSIAADMERQQEHRVAGTRYITLTHLHNACTETKAFEPNQKRQSAERLMPIVRTFDITLLV